MTYEPFAETDETIQMSLEIGMLGRRKAIPVRCCATLYKIVPCGAIDAVSIKFRESHLTQLKVKLVHQASGEICTELQARSSSTNPLPHICPMRTKDLVDGSINVIEIPLSMHNYILASQFSCTCVFPLSYQHPSI